MSNVSTYDCLEHFACFVQMVCWFAEVAKEIASFASLLDLELSLSYLVLTEELKPDASVYIPNFCASLTLLIVQQGLWAARLFALMYAHISSTTLENTVSYPLRYTAGSLRETLKRIVLGALRVTARARTAVDYLTRLEGGKYRQVR